MKIIIVFLCSFLFFIISSLNGQFLVPTYADCCMPAGCEMPRIYEERDGACDNDPSEICEWTVWKRTCERAQCNWGQTCTCVEPDCYIYYGAYRVIGCAPCDGTWISISFLWAVVYGDPDCDESKCFFGCDDNELPEGSDSWSPCLVPTPDP